MNYGQQATKTLIKAKPSINEDGKVVKWELELEYSLSNYTVKFSSQPEISSPSKEPQEFTLSELKSLAKESYYDHVYDSMYQSTQLPSEPSTITTVDNFDVSSLDD